MIKYRDGAKDAELMLDGLGSPLRRSMVRRLRMGGAMSLSKLAKPFNISLPATLKHTRLLEETGLITTHKRGRVRICVYNPSAFRQLAGWLASQSAFWERSLGRLEKHFNNRRKK